MKTPVITHWPRLVDQVMGKGVVNVKPGVDVLFAHAFSFARASLSTPHN